ncbi:MAG: 3-hydroxyacyl-CoA dehydrogenase NAD-binding domain-containing protein [Parachlamydiaceae bacterium]
MEQAFKLSVDNEGVARLVFDLPGEKVNKFSMPVLEELEKHLDAMATDKRIKVLGISSAKPDVFIAGADLHSFEPIFKDPSQGATIINAGHRVFNKLQNLPFPTVALIHGACLGGGMELALACTYRIVSDHPKTQLGLPEVSLGIIPGWGGTQRMPRLVGLVEALPLVLGGKSVKANKAWKIRLADGIAAPEFFGAYGDRFLKRCLTIEGRKEIAKRRQRKGLRQALLEANPVGRSFVCHQAKKDILRRTKGHYPAPVVALDLIKKSYALPLKEGLALEAKTFVDCLISDFSNAPNLIHLFFVQEALKKDSGVSGVTKLLNVQSAAVIGAGTMGSGIAWLFSNKDIPVRMKDVDWTSLGKGFGAAHAIYTKLVKEKRLKSGEASLKFHKISGTTDYSGFKDVDIVVEAAVENIDLKHAILKDLEAAVRSDAIIASNTSSLRIADMGKVLKHPERFIGMHFFNPANKMPLVEVVASEKTSPETIATVVDLCRKLGKTPIVVRDCAGFLVNRIFMTGVNEIMRMYEEGAGFDQLEKMMLDFGMPMSPFSLADEVGNDVGYKVGKSFEAAYGERMTTPKLITLMYEQKLYGKKCGKGFYLYEGDKKKINPEVEKLRCQVGAKQVSISTDEMRARTFLLMINEAARCLDEKVVANADYLDMALILGIGFPPFRGGLMRYAHSLGIDNIVKQLNVFEQKYGSRFTPSSWLLKTERK